MTEFANAAELFAHYRAVRERVKAWRPPARPEPPKPAPEPPLPAPTLPPGKVHMVAYAVSVEWSATVVKYRELLGKSRLRILYRPRAVAMYLAHTLGLASTTYIGRVFGDRDHTSVVHAIKNARQWIAAEPEIAAFVERLEQKLIQELKL